MNSYVNGVPAYSVGDITAGQRVFVLSPEHPDTFVGVFVRTNIVIGEQQREFLYATVQLDDGSYRAFDINRAVVITG